MIDLGMCVLKKVVNAPEFLRYDQIKSVQKNVIPMQPPGQPRVFPALTRPLTKVDQSRYAAHQ